MRIPSPVFAGFSSRGTNVVRRVWFNAGFETGPRTFPETQTMHGPAKNRLHGYEEGWLTLLIEMRVATRREAQEAQSRVAQAAIAKMEARRAKRRAERRRRGRKEG